MWLQELIEIALMPNSFAFFAATSNANLHAICPQPQCPSITTVPPVSRVIVGTAFGSITFFSIELVYSINRIIPWRHVQLLVLVPRTRQLNQHNF